MVESTDDVVFGKPAHHEIGIRMALGANKHDVLKLVCGQWYVVGLSGCPGRWLPHGLNSIVSTLLYETKTTDPATICGTAADTNICRNSGVLYSGEESSKGRPDGRLEIRIVTDTVIRHFLGRVVYPSFLCIFGVPGYGVEIDGTFRHSFALA